MVSIKVKVKFTIQFSMKTEREEYTYSAALSLNWALEDVGGQSQAPSASFPGK
jgi:hypothetical protein